MTSRIRHDLGSFPRQLLHELHCSFNPVDQVVVILEAFRLHHYPAFHWPAGDVELSDVRLLKCVIVVVGAETDDQRVLPDADEHVAVEKEADAAEHLLLFDTLLATQGVTNAGGERFVERHRSLLPCVMHSKNVTATHSRFRPTASPY